MPEKQIPSEIIAIFERSDYISVYPYLLFESGADYLEKVLEKHKTVQSNKLFLIFVVDDYEFELKSYSQQIILRTSLRKSEKQENEMVLPYLFFEQGEVFKPLARTKRPVVGFCGMNNRHRSLLLEKVTADSRISDNLILKKHFWAGAQGEERVIREFNENIKNSHFVLCNRGSGNFSMRLYQTLAFGRIPALVNTDMEFPFEDEIDYDKLMILGDSEEEVLEKIVSVWENSDIMQMQDNCAQVFRSYFSIENYALALRSQIDSLARERFHFCKT